MDGACARTRAIFFDMGKAVSPGLSQADGNIAFRATKNAAGFDLIDAGDERYGIPESVVFGAECAGRRPGAAAFFPFRFAPP